MFHILYFSAHEVEILTGLQVKRNWDKDGRGKYEDNGQR